MSDRDTPRLLILVVALTALLLLVGLVVFLADPPAPPPVATGPPPRAVTETRSRPTPRPRGATKDEREVETPEEVEEPALHGSVRVSLSGQLLSADSGDPIGDATVSAHHLTGELLGRTRTDERGAYRLDGLPAGTRVALRLSAPGYRAGWCCDVPLPDSGTHRQPTVHLAHGTRLRVDESSLEELPVGAVVEWESPTVGATTHSVDPRGSEWIGLEGRGAVRWRLRWGAVVSSWSTATLDSYGRFVTAGGMRDVRTRHREREVELPETVSLTVSLQSGETDVAGRVALIDASGTELAGVALAGPRAEFPTVFATGRCAVVVRTEDGRVGRADVDLSRRSHAYVRLERPGRVEVVVADAEHAVVPGVRVRVASVTGISDGAGVARVSGVPPGDWPVTVDGPAHAAAPDTEGVRVRVAAGYESQVQVAVVGVPHTHLDLRLTDSLGRPLAEHVVQLPELDLRATTDQYGRVHFGAVPIGLRVTPEVEGHRVRTASRRRTVTPLAGAPTHHLIARAEELRERPEDGPLRRVRGRVLDASGSPLLQAVVGAGRRLRGVEPDGSFEVKLPIDVRELVIGTQEGLHVAQTVELEPDATAPVELGERRLARRPVALLQLVRDDSPDRFHARTVLIATSYRDSALDQPRGALAVETVTTYDGTWVTLPPVAIDGRPFISLGSLDEVGLHTELVTWSPEMERTARIHVTPAEPGTLRGKGDGSVSLRQVDHAHGRELLSLSHGLATVALRGRDPFREWLEHNPILATVALGKRGTSLAAGAWRTSPLDLAAQSVVEVQIRPGMRSIFKHR